MKREFETRGASPTRQRTTHSRKALADAFIAALCQDFLDQGVAMIEKIRDERPVDYLKIIVSLLPKETEKPGSALDAIGDDELEALVAGARARLAFYGGVQAETGESDGMQSPELLPSLSETS